MTDLSTAEHHIHCVTNFQDLVSTPFHGEMNAICWTRTLSGDFSEIVQKIELNENMEDLKMLKAQGASPILNLIRCYERDESFPFFPTDVYSFHVDRSPVPTDTFLCTYYGESSEILPNAQAEQKVLLPEIRDALKKLYNGAEEGFESFLNEHFFDLHYQAKPKAQPFSLGLGHLWKLAVDHPESQAAPCIHRAPTEKAGESRLLLIC